MDSAKDVIGEAMSLFDNPNNLGNYSATAQLVIEDTVKIERTAEQLIDIAKNAEKEDKDLFVCLFSPF